MKQNKIALKTMAIKAKVANFLKTELYNYSDNDYMVKYKNKKSIKELNKEEFFNKLYPLVKEMYHDLYMYKLKRINKKNLLEKRLAAPQTPSMIKKLKKFKINLVNSN